MFLITCVLLVGFWVVLFWFWELEGQKVSDNCQIPQLLVFALGRLTALLMSVWAYNTDLAGIPRGNGESSLQPQECDSDVSADHLRTNGKCWYLKGKKKNNAFNYLETFIFCWLWNWRSNLRSLGQKGSISLWGTPWPSHDLSLKLFTKYKCNHCLHRQ